MFLDEDTHLRYSKYNFTQLMPSNLRHLLNLSEIFKSFKQRVFFFLFWYCFESYYMGRKYCAGMVSFFPHSCITPEAKVILLKRASLSHKSRSVNDLWIGIKQTGRKILR